MNLLRQHRLNPEGCLNRRCILREVVHSPSSSPEQGLAAEVATRRREPGSCRRKYGGVKEGLLRGQALNRWCESRVKVARSTRSGRDTTVQVRQYVHLYIRALVRMWLFSSQYPAARALLAPNMVRYSEVPRSLPAIFSCLMLIIELSASKCHVLDEQTKRIGEGVVQVGAYGVDGRSPCSATRAP